MSEPWPLYDLFLDLPHPAASPSCPPPVIVKSPASTCAEELSEADSIARIARFAFPEHDDQIPSPPPPAPESAGLNRYDVYTVKGFQRHTFSLQLASGQRVHGHVRRYLPMHQQASSRYDVGRRGVRATVLLTRNSAGDSTYYAILKTVQAIENLQASGDNQLGPDPLERFLTACQEQHVGYCRYYAQKPDDERRPMLLTIQGTEFESPKFKTVDTSRFLLPTSLLQPPNALSNITGMTESPILPLLRCLGVANALRLLSALLSERRIILISSSPTRLTACARSALSILAQGQLYWQHLFIPVLPPHLFQYLQAPMPYLVGMLSSNMEKLNQMHELGEVLLINLDQNAMETRGIPTNLIASRIPDMVRGGGEMDPNTGAYEMTAADCLVQDLMELLKMDKRATAGEMGVQEAAKETVKAVKSALGKLRKKGEKYLQQQRSSSFAEYSSSGPGTPQESEMPLDDEIYFECVQNDVGEEEARIAFAMFFLCAYGDMRWYLVPGPSPQLDRQRFLQQKRSYDSEALFPLYQNMSQSQMFEQFVKERVEEIRARMPVAKDSPLFAVCSNYQRKNQIDFGVISVRRVARQVAQANPGRIVSQANANARRLAMSLTSNKTFEGNQSQAVAQLVEMAHETSSVLCDVMSVVWMRIRDSRGMQWKHGLQALILLRNLLYHGPLAAIPEATDGIDKIRDLKRYNDTMRSQNSAQIRTAAEEVYNLLVDRAKLFAIRRTCADRRRLIKNPPPGRLPKETRMRIGVPFCNIHSALAPNARRQVAPAPGQQGNATAAQVQDLLGFDSTPAAPAKEPNVNDILGVFGSQATITPAPAPAPPAAAATSFGGGAPVVPQKPSTPVRDPFGPTSPAPKQRPSPSPARPTQPQPAALFGVASPAQPPPPQRVTQNLDPFAASPAPRPQQPDPFAVSPAPRPQQPNQYAVSPVPRPQQPPQQQQQRPQQQLQMDPFAPSPSRPSQQPPKDPFATSAAPVLQQQRAPPQQPPKDPFAASPGYPVQQSGPQQQQMVPVQNRAGPFGGPGYAPNMQQGGAQVPNGQPNMPPPNMQQGGYPQQPGRQPTMFASPPAQQAQQPPPRKNLSQFDPMAR